jgi:aminomethyltransferase
VQSPLFEWHLEVGAKLSDFGGWQMPIEYPKAIGAMTPGGVIAEHTAVREIVGIFDVSHLGKIEVSGIGALQFLNRMISNDLNRIGHGSAQYNLLCDPFIATTMKSSFSFQTRRTVLAYLKFLNLKMIWV